MGREGPDHGQVSKILIIEWGAEASGRLPSVTLGAIQGRKSFSKTKAWAWVSPPFPNLNCHCSDIDQVTEVLWLAKPEQSIKLQDVYSLPNTGGTYFSCKQVPHSQKTHQRDPENNLFLKAYQGSNLLWKMRRQLTLLIKSYCWLLEEVGWSSCLKCLPPSSLPTKLLFILPGPNKMSSMRIFPILPQSK